jgi:hypothetical protein
MCPDCPAGTEAGGSWEIVHRFVEIRGPALLWPAYGCLTSDPLRVWVVPVQTIY